MAEREAGAIDAGLLRALAALAGVELGEARGEALAAQAEPHFGLLRQLAAVANPADEPAGVFRLDDRDAGDGG